jgi:hypothetical protein
LLVTGPPKIVIWINRRKNHVARNHPRHGAAGGVGSTAHSAIATLREHDHRVRAMVRKLDARADKLRDMGAEIVVADMLDIVAVRAAMQGCSVVYFTMSISPTYVEAAANVAVTAKSLGVKAFVNLSQMTDERDRDHKQPAPEAALARRADAALVRPAGGLSSSNRVLRRHVPGAGGQGHPATRTSFACRSPMARPR